MCVCVCVLDHDGNIFLTVGYGQICPREKEMMIEVDVG